MDDAFLPLEDSDQAVAADGESAPEPMIACWRCHKVSAASTAICPYCEATLAPSAVDEKRLGSSPITPVCFVFSLLLVVTVVQAGLAYSVDPNVRNADVQRLQIMLVAEAIDTMIVVAHGAVAVKIHPLDAGLSRPVDHLGRFATIAGGGPGNQFWLPRAVACLRQLARRDRRPGLAAAGPDTGDSGDLHSAGHYRGAVFSLPRPGSLARQHEHSWRRCSCPQSCLAWRTSARR